MEAGVDSSATSTRIMLQADSLWVQERMHWSMQMQQGKPEMNRPVQLWRTLPR